MRSIGDNAWCKPTSAQWDKLNEKHTPPKPYNAETFERGHLAATIAEKVGAADTATAAAATDSGDADIDDITYNMP